MNVTRTGRSSRVTLSGEIVELVFEFVDRMVGHLGNSADEFNLSPPQALALLRLEEPLPMHDLAERLRCDASNVTGIVDKLEARGLVERKVDEGDRRVKNLVLTDEGADLLDRLKASLSTDVPGIGSLSKVDQQALRDLFRRALLDS